MAGPHAEPITSSARPMAARKCKRGNACAVGGLMPFGPEKRARRVDGRGKRCAYAAALLFLALAPGGCSSVLTAGTAAGAGATGAGIARAVTDNPGVTAGIGIGVLAAATAGLQYTERVVHHAEQDRIAATAGILPVGAVGHWQVVHNIPIEADEHGEVTVSRVLGGPGFICKEIVFSVDRTGKQGAQRAFYTTTICRDGTVWKWASAEPATERWGSLQ